MVSCCSVPSCRNKRTLANTSRGITFHKFPKDKKLRRKWEGSLRPTLRRRDFAATKNSLCCSEHFRPEDFDRTGQTVRLREGTIPSVFSFSTPGKAVATRRTTETSRKAQENSPSVGDPQRSRTTKTSIKAEESGLSVGDPQCSRTTETSIKAEESGLSVGDPPRSKHTKPNGFFVANYFAISRTDATIKATAKDHPYVLPGTLNGLKAKLGESQLRESKLRDDLKRMMLELRKAKAREQRAKEKVSSLLKDLQETNSMNEELTAKLGFFSDVPMALLAKQGHEYTKDQREFALTLHLHGPKAYDYLRNTLHLNLPHPHTLQRWTRTSNISGLDFCNGTESEGPEPEGACMGLIPPIDCDCDIAMSM